VSGSRYTALLSPVESVALSDREYTTIERPTFGQDHITASMARYTTYLLTGEEIA
jgi:hypothetical protein